MKMGVMEDVKNASLKEVGEYLFSMLGCEVYFLEPGRRKFYICRMF